MKKNCIIITGPTAVGKTALAIEIARHFSTKIISADSRQCYSELNIGVAKPSPAELQAVHHYFINSHSIKNDLSAADFETYALNAAKEIFSENDIAVMVGGTGLYIKAFCEGLDDIPPANETIRKEIIENYSIRGMAFLQKEIEKNDPEYYRVGEIQNPQRMIRALEVAMSTGRSILSWRSKQKKHRDFNMVKIGLQLPREILYNRINKRVDQMIIDGLVEEVKGLIIYKERNSLQTVGYRELFDYFEDKTSLARAIELIKQNTRHYAKRQITWFKKEEGIEWFAPDKGEVLKAITGRIQS